MDTKIESGKLIKMYKKMILIREFELRINILYQEALVYGGAHLSVGQEAIAVGVCENLNTVDYMVSTHRGHGQCIAKGADIKPMMAELMAKSTGSSKGKGGSQHIVDFSVGFIGAQGIVGAGIPIAAGAAISIKLRQEHAIVVCTFGDGATNTGSFHEGINLAACLNLPVIFILENNLYAVTTCISKSCKLQNLYERAKAYGIPTKVIDGNNIFEVYQTVKEAADYAKKGLGPYFIECQTYRWFGHYVGDPATYRPKEEVDSWKARDPIKFLGNYLIENKIINADDDIKIKKEMKIMVDESVEFAKNSPDPSLDSLLDDVYYIKS